MIQFLFILGFAIGVAVLMFSGINSMIENKLKELMEQKNDNTN